MSCDLPHPDRDGVSCNRPGDGPQKNHPNHTGEINGQFIDWPNAEFKPTKRRGKHSRSTTEGKLKEMANRVADKPKEVKHYIPSEVDARGRVALYLLKYLNEWIDLDELTPIEVGGSAADKKLQELINFNWPIEVDGDRYRLTADPRKPLWETD